MTLTYRSLNKSEIERLEHNGCRCADWTSILVKDGFRPDRYVRVCFSGKIKLGGTERTVINRAGVELESGIFDSNVVNCTIGDNVRIAGVRECLSNYTIGDGCLIANVGTLASRPGAGFGNGTRVNVLNETGGRTNILYDRLSSQIAYMMTFYRHDTIFTEKLLEIIENYVKSKRTDSGTIGNNAVITNCGTIMDVNIGDQAVVDGATLLSDGTVGPMAHVGSGVIGEHFIMQSQSTVDNASIVKNSFVGQASHLSNCFIAHDSMFFANCVMECGEAVATFAGPHTVSMHKSSLLIGGYFSFFNAGSGTNQSNHLYKLGPMHQGIMERGCKTTSNAYVMWPARFGMFTLVSGSHYGHPDTSVLPYSYALSVNGKTHVVPGANLKTIGTIRDLMKWGKRDKRVTDLDRFDIVNYDTLSPLTTNVMYRAIKFLNDFDTDPSVAERHRFSIKQESIKKGKEYYALGMEYFMGESFVQHLLAINPDSKSALNAQLGKNNELPYMKWADIAGMIAPIDLINELRKNIASGQIGTLPEIEHALSDINRRYYDLKWAYTQANLPRSYSVPVDDLSPEMAISIINRWTEAVRALDAMRKEDALKDFAPSMSTGFGFGDDEETGKAEFICVNGNPEEHEVIVDVHRHYANALLDAHEMVARIKKTFAITD